ncbi:MAG: lipooligosaccharide transport system ATP-binding protein [Thermoplasmata archaeon]|nr:lipooligosaccharide transport system ATP-binding protein [Thermoplasmata archaeon]
MDAVAAKDLRKSFGELKAVDGVTLAIAEGTCFGLLGPNGAGKTTTIRMMQAQSTPTGGSLTVLGLDTTKAARKVKARVGVVPQENNLDPDFTVHKNLTVYARFFRIPAKVATERADKLLDFVQLTDKRDALIPTLSGGMKRRLTVARALVNDPDMLILDEPTTGLDPQARHTIWEKIRSLRRQGKTILLSTHYMDEAEQLCDTIVVMDQGKILEQGTPRDLIQKHTQGEAVEFVVGWSEDGGPVARCADVLKASGIPFERLPDRVIGYGDKAVAAVPTAHEALGAKEVIRRRATLEDVFLRLTGRALRD